MKTRQLSMVLRAASAVMNSRRIRATLSAIAGLSLLLRPSESATAAGNSQITITDLGVLPGGIYSSAYSINNNGKIAGMGQEGSPDYFGHAVVWLKSSFQVDLGFMGGGTYSEAYGINDFGDVVGVASVASTAHHAFLWRNGQFTDLSTWTGGGASSVAYAINNQGEIVGLNASVASLWKNGAVQDARGATGKSNVITVRVR